MNLKILFLWLSLTCISLPLLSQIDIWGKYVYQDTLEYKYKNNTYYFDSELFLKQEDSSYIYTIKFHSKNSMQTEEVSSIGKISVKGRSIFLRDTTVQNKLIGIDVYEDLRVDMGCLAIVNEPDPILEEPIFYILVPFDPPNNYCNGCITTAEWGIIFDGDSLKEYEFYGSLRSGRFINQSYENVEEINYLKREKEAQYFQIYRKQYVYYDSFVSMTTYSEKYPMPSLGLETTIMIHVNRNVFIPYIDTGWFINTEHENILLERDRYSNDLLFVNLRKIASKN